MPMRFGGKGLRSAARMAPATFWASWADALRMISKRLPEVANRVTVELTNGQNLHECVREFAVASEQLDRHGFVDRPSWADLQRGVRPPVAVSVEPGEWQHGWQHHASSSSEFHFRETVMFAQSPTWLICARIRVQVQETCSVLQPTTSSRSSLDSSER